MGATLRVGRELPRMALRISLYDFDREFGGDLCSVVQPRFAGVEQWGASSDNSSIRRSRCRASRARCEIFLMTRTTKVSVRFVDGRICETTRPAYVLIVGSRIMHLITHFLTGWAASLPIELDPRDRGLIAFASISSSMRPITTSFATTFSSQWPHRFFSDSSGAASSS